MPLTIPNTLMRPLQLITRVMQWISAVIVMSLSAYFIDRGPRGQHIIYQVVIASISVLVFLPAFISPFLPNVLAKFVFLIDVIFSYLWLTAFIFAAQDYNWHQCFLNAPPGLGCSRKRANEAFIFLALYASLSLFLPPILHKAVGIPGLITVGWKSIFTFFGMLLELLSLWSYRQEDRASAPEREKNGHAAAPPAPGDGAAAGAGAGAGAGSAPATSTV